VVAQLLARIDALSYRSVIEQITCIRMKRGNNLPPPRNPHDI
jgi:hypothetical protein